MAKKIAGPLANTPRDQQDDFVGAPAEEIVAPEPMRWPPKPRKITKDTFHSKVAGNTSMPRPDRKPHFRRGGMVSGHKSGGALSRVSASTKKGGLHESLDIPQGEKIGAARIAKATHSSDPKTRKQANLAQTYAKYRK